MTPESYEQTLLLEEVELRQLLQTGASLQRVWAAWVLGLRRGADFASGAGAQLLVEPDPGVRRHLAVILAGAGDRAAIAALAEHDPSELVRGTALRLLLQMVRLVERPQVIAQLLRVAQEEPSALVRELALELLASVPDTLPTQGIISCLADARLEVRERAAALLMETPCRDVIEGLTRHSTTEPDAHLQEKLWRHLRDGGRSAQLMEAFCSTEPSADALHRLCAVLREARVKLPWSQLEYAASLNQARLDLYVFELVDVAASLSLEFLFSRAIAGLSINPGGGPSYELQEAGRRAVDALASIDPAEVPVVLDAEQQRFLEWRLEVIDAEESAQREALAEALRLDSDEEPDEEFDEDANNEFDDEFYIRDAIDCMVELRTGLKRLLAGQTVPKPN